MGELDNKAKTPSVTYGATSLKEGGFRFHLRAETKSLLQREKVDFAKQKTDEVLYASETTHPPPKAVPSTFAKQTRRSLATSSPHKGRLFISLRLDIKGSLTEGAPDGVGWGS